MPILDKVFKAAVAMNASDVHVIPGEPFMVRHLGKLIRLKSQPLTAEHTIKMVNELLSPSQRESMASNQQLDFAYEIEDLGRFRGSAMLHNN